MQFGLDDGLGDDFLDTSIQVRVPSFVTSYSAFTAHAHLRTLETLPRRNLCIDIIPPAGRLRVPESEYFHSTGWNQRAKHSVPSLGLRIDRVCLLPSLAPRRAGLCLAPLWCLCDRYKKHALFNGARRPTADDHVALTHFPHKSLQAPEAALLHPKSVDKMLRDDLPPPTSVLFQGTELIPVL